MYCANHTDIHSRQRPMDHTLDAALNQLWERTSRALEDAQRNARFVERLEEETKKLKEQDHSG